MLTSETPTALADGDVVTFGKTVGKDRHFVPPVIVRIELLHGAAPLFTVPLVNESSPVTCPRSSEGSKPPLRSNSGRYGVYVPSSSSDDSSKSDHDSDVEEIESPLPVSRLTRSNHDGDSTSTHVGRALEVLKRLMPPVHTPTIHSGSRCPDPTSLYFPRSPLPEYYPRSPSSLSCHSPLLPYFNPPINPVSAGYSPIGFDAYNNDVFEEQCRSKSTSPMDLASPSPAPCDKPPVEPVVIGAWPTSRSSSPALNEQLCGPGVDDVGPQAIEPPTMSVEGRESSPRSTSGVSVEAIVPGSRLPTKSPTASENVARDAPTPQTSRSDSGMRDDIIELKSCLNSVRVSMQLSHVLYVGDEHNLCHSGRAI